MRRKHKKNHFTFDKGRHIGILAMPGIVVADEGELIEIDSCIKDKKRKVVDANETPVNEFIFAYTGSTNLPTDSASGGLLTLGFMDGSSSSKLQFFFQHNNVFKRIQWYNSWQNWEKIKTE